jgi:amino acid adenylation domain-containing protein/non-ribosomal peptide synthase protein (TIGR01720 family)
MSYNEDNTQKITDVCNEIQSNIDLKENLVKASLIHGEEDDYFFLDMHHLVVDGVSWRVISSDLELAYSQLLKGEEVKLPDKTNSYNDYAEALEKYRDSYKMAKEIPYWEKVQSKLMKMPFSDEKDYSRRFNKVTVQLDKENTRKFVSAKFTSINGDVNVALLTALCRSYKNIFGENSVSIQFEGHGREDIGQNLLIDRTVGWFTSIYPVVVENITGNIEKDLLNVKETMYRVPNKGVGYNVLRFIEGKHKVNFTTGKIAKIGFNYLGEMSAEQQEESLFGNAGIDTGAAVSEKNVFGPDLSINCVVSDGYFNMMLDYNTALVTPEQAKNFVDGILLEMQEITAFLSSVNVPLITASDLGENVWNMEEFNGVAADFASRNEKIKRIYPLTPMQEGMLLEYISNPRSWAYKIVMAFELNKLPSENQLNKALERLASKHEVLRTAFIYDGVGEPRQAIIDRKLPLIMLDYSDRQDSEAAVLELREEIMTNAYDLQRKSIFQLYCVKKSDNSCYLLTVCHHALVDGWCMNLYIGSLMQFIDEELTGIYTEDEKPADGIYEEAIREIYDKDKNEALDYWHNLLEDYNTRTEIPSFGEISADEQSVEDELLTFIDKETTDKFTALCKQENATISNGLELVWGLLLQTYSRTDDAVFVKVVSGRDNTTVDVNSLVGLFINSIPVRVKQDKSATARTMLQVLQKQASESNAYDFCSLSEIQQQSELGTQLFQTVFTFENYASGSEEKESVYSFDLKFLYYKDENFGDIDPIISINGEGKLKLRLSFNNKRYRMSEIKRVAELFKVLVTGIAEYPDKALSELPRINAETEKEILSLSAGEIYDYDKTVTWIDVFNQVEADKPNNVAVIDIDGSITYNELRKYSNAFANYLIDNGVQAGDFVAVRMSRSYNFEIAVQGIHRAGAAYVPIDVDYPKDRIDYILEDSKAKLEITSLSCANGKLIINGNTEIKAEGAEEINLSVPAGLSYMIYTSGSTGKPKGVMMPHSGMINFIHYVRETCHLNESSRITCHSNFAFDVSVESLYPVLTAGGAVFIVPEEARKDITAMRNLIKEYGITGGGYSTAVGQLLGADYTLDVDYINLAGERMTIIPECTGTVINGYGPTETCYCTYYKLDKNRDYSAGIPIGRPLYNLTGFIVDQHNRLVPRGVTGELCIAGPQVAKGYWNRPDLTAEKFTMLNGNHQVRVYHTGDLCRYNEDGQLEYQGRIDFQVKLSGFRIELGEIDNCAARYQNIGQVITQIKNNQLVLYYTSSEKIDNEALKSFMAESLAEYMVPAVFIQLDEMPMTPNGKIDRRKLPDPEVNYGEIVPPATEMEEKVFAFVEGLLNKDGFGVTTNLLSLGLSSLAAMRMSIALRKEFDVDVKVSQIMKNPTVRSLAKIIVSNDTEQNIINHITDREYYPITENQRGIYIEWEMNRDTTQYNIPIVYKFKDKNAIKLVEAVKNVIDTHSVLKTRFALINSDIMQQPHADEAAEVLFTSLDVEPTEKFFQSRVKPFDLFNDKLYRAEVYSYNENTYLFLDIHHTFYDGLSTSVMVGDILSAYEGRELAAEEITAYDFAVYEKELTNSEAYANAEKYYDELVADATAVNYSNSKIADGIKSCSINISIEAKHIDTACAKYGVTVSSFFNATFAEVLSRISREENPMYLTVSNGREADTRLSSCIGMFVKTIPVVLRTENHGKESVGEYVKDFQNQLQTSINNNFYPYTKIVEKHDLRGKVMFAYQGGMMDGVSTEGIESIPVELDTGKFPVNVVAYRMDEHYVIIVDYDGMRYSKQDMEILIEAIKNTAISMAKVEMVSDIEMVSEEEKVEIISRSCGETIEYDSSETWLSMFAMQVKNQPERLAVADGNSSYTYGELDEISNKVAAYLISKGVAVNDFVAVKMNRAKEYAAAVIGIQKAGAAFVPVDMSYPAERIEYMLADSKAKISLTEEDVKAIAAENTAVESIDRSKPENRAYMIYTSGSTGRPKGVVLHQRGLMNLTKGVMSILDLTNEDRISSHRSFSFDAHIDDFYPTFSAGASVHIMPDEIRKDLDQIYDFLMEHEITGGGYTTSIAKLLLTNYDLKQRFISCGGEALRDVKSDTVQIFNLYGPTECTNDTTIAKLEKGRYYESAPVGTPMINGYCFIVDSYGKLVPQGVRGEICYAGPQTGYGYWNLDDKTKEVFEDCPFVNGLRMYHTGDVGYYNAEGQIEYVGRIDFQVKLNGFRIELGEIEGKALQFAGVRQVSAQVRKSQICLYYSTDKEVDKDELNEFLSTALASYMIPTVYMPLEVMPLTPNGKVDRKALPEPEITIGEIVAPANELEENILNVAVKFVKAENFGVTNNLISLGMSSLSTMRFSAALKSELDLQVRVADIMKNPTIRAIADLLQDDTRVQRTVKAYTKREFYPLTGNQRGVYLDWEMNQDITQYNMAGIKKMSDFEADRLADAITSAVNAHSYLKMRLAINNGEVMQQPHDDEPVNVTVTELTSEPDLDFFQSRVRAFNLFNDTLYRFEIYKAKGEVYLFMDIHHIVFDGLSLKLFMADVLKAYNGEKLVPEKITAYDFAIYENEISNSELFIEAEKHFDNLLAGTNPAVYMESTVPDGIKAANCAYKFSAKAINDFCTANGVTVSSYMQAAFAETLQRLTREENMLYLTANNGRADGAAMENTVGMFAKTVPVVLRAEGDEHGNKLAADYIGEMQEQLQQTYDYDFYPYTNMVDRHQIKAEIILIYQGGVMEDKPNTETGAEANHLKLDTTTLPVYVDIFPGEDYYKITINYDGLRYNKKDMESLARAMGNIAESMATAKYVKDAKLVSDEEAKEICALSRGKKFIYDTSETWVNLFLKQAAVTPENTAVMDVNNSLNYRELDQQSDCVANYLISNGVKPGDFVAVELERIKEFHVAVLGIHKAGAAYVPVDLSYPEDRIEYILENSEAKSVLTEELLKEIIAADKYKSDVKVNKAVPDGVAYMIYTSGSTGRPKGVMIPHKALLNFIHYVRNNFGISEKSRISCHASFSFDLSMEALYPALTVGGAVFIVPEEARHDVNIMRQLIAEKGINGGFYPTQYGQILAGDKNNPLDVDYIGLCGEKMTSMLYARGNVYNTYGPTEFTDFATCVLLDQQREYRDIPIGRPMDNLACYVVDRYNHLVPRGAVGELCIAGIQSSYGYWKLPEKTAEVFGDCQFDGFTGMYHTGDLARYNEEDQMECLGRIDFQVKLRGFRIELGEIESVALKFAGVKQAVAQVRMEQLVLYYTVEEAVDKSELETFLAGSLTEYMVPTVYMQMDAMPMTPNGKINRKALPDPQINAGEVVEPANEIECKILETAFKIMKKDGFGVTNNLISLGMSSLAAMRLGATLTAELGVQIKVSDIMKHPTVRFIAGLYEENAPKDNIDILDNIYSAVKLYMNGKGEAEATLKNIYELLAEHYNDRSETVHHYPIQEYYPLTENQRGVYLDWEMNSDTTQYNIPSVRRFKVIDVEKLEEAIKNAVNAHSYLKNRFVVRDGDVMQEPHFADDVEVQVIDLAEEPAEDFFQTRIRPFDLKAGNLYRFELYKTADFVYMFMDVHHTVFDGMSTIILLNDIMQAYNGISLQDEQITAYDFAMYENEFFFGNEYKKAEEYFDKLANEAVAVSYPAYSVPDGVKEANLEKSIPAQAIDDTCARFGITPNAYFQTALSEVLLRFSRESNPMYLTISNGRPDGSNMQNTVGMFVKTLPVVVHTELGKHKEKSVADFAREIHEELQQTYAYSLYPYTEIVERHGLKGEILFAYQGGMVDEDSAADDNVEQLPIKLDTSKLPVLISVYNKGNDYIVNVEYDGLRYGKADIAILLDSVVDVAVAMTSAEKMKNISLVNHDEENALINLGCGPVLERDQSETIISIFKNRVAETPNKVAVVFKDKKYTYAELDRISDNLAVYLKKNYDIKAGENVGVMINRSELMLIYPLAIMKNGAAYMPLDPHFPTDRLNFMCDDASVKVILSEGSLLEEKLPDFAGDKFNSSELNNIPEVSGDETGILTAPKANDRMVILFTSGSTGVPKAVELEQHSIANFCHWYAKDFELTADDRVSAYANFGFDAHMMDIYPAIFAGATVYILPDEMRKDLQLVNEYMEEMGITVSFFTTQVGCLIKDMNKSLRLMSVGGEKLPLTTAPAYRFVNGYGPTECAIYSATCDVEGTADGTYIGRPLANYQLYVIDKNCQLVPRGAAGELLICGEGVARGYMNRPELTAEKFITFKPAEDSEPVRAYRSGDLVRWAENDNIQYLGRIDKQVKLRGLRIELGEIENRVASFTGIKQVAVDVKNDQLCCYYVAEAEINKDELKAHLAEKLTEFMVPEVYMQLDVMPLNANGKVDRKALPEPEVEIGEIITPATPMEETLFAIVAKVLKQDKFGVTTNLISVGMSSLAAMRLSTAINTELGKQVRVADIMKQPTVRGLVAVISSLVDDGNRIKIGTKQEYYPITENQRGIYIDWEMNRDTTQYNIPFVYKFKNIEANKLAEAVRTAVNAHSGMKASFVAYNGDIMQKPRWDDTVEVPVTDVFEPLNKEFFQSMVKPFDLAEDKLYRLEVFNTPDAAVLFMDIHHIVFDGLSTSLLMKDIMSAYNGEEVSEETVTAYDLANYEYEMVSSEAYQQAEARFDRLLSEANAVSYPVSSKPDGEKSAHVYGTISSDGIDKFCSEHGLTINSYMQAAFAEALQRIIREAKPMYITISNGRSADSRLANTVGMFVKTLPVVLDTVNNNHGEDKVIDYIMSMQNQLQESYTQEFYPYTKVVERNQLHTNVMFACQVGLGDEIQPETYGDIEGIELSLDTVKTPVDVTVSRVADGYSVSINYDGMKYGRKDMEALLNAIINVSETMLTAEKVKNIKLINADEEKAIAEASRGEALDYNTEATWLSMLSEQINSRADEIAVVDKDGSYSFGELENVSNKIAGYLISKGVAENDFVTIKMGRKKEFIAAVIAVHKLGAAYVPVDEDYPEERIQYIAENSEAKLIITKAFVDEALASDIEAAEFTAKATPDHLAYMIYTSGSTGKPKGVMIPHRAMMNFVNFIRVRWNINENSRIACHSNFAFDASVEDLYPVLTAGGTLYIVPEEERKDIILMREYIKNNNITGGCYTTQLGQMLGADETVDVEYICLGGEKMTTVPKVTGHVYNTYGPTEFTVDATYFELEKGVEYSDIPIGRPLHNCSALILDSYGNLMPDGMVGELCLSGPQLAKGYWKLPEKTAEVFKTININGENIDIYRTGDLARYNENGYIEYLGRIDFQVKLRGFRIEMGEIENRAASYNGIKSVIAQVKTVGSIENLCLYYSAETEIDKENYRDYLAESLADYMVPTVYMQLAEMPMTPNGKIDRKKLPEPVLEIGEIIAPATEIEEKVFAVAAEVLNIDNFGVTNNLISMGMSSLAAMRLASKISNEIGCQIRVADIMKKCTIRDIAEMLNDDDIKIMAVQHYEEREYYPLTENQRGIYIDWEMNRGTTQYNIPSVYKFKAINAETLIESIKIAVNAHGYIKNRFVEHNGDLMQQAHLADDVEVLFAELTTEPDNDFFQSRILPFDLINNKLYRFEVYKTPNNVYLFADIHHTVFDGLSSTILFGDIMEAYNGNEIKAENVTAYDFALYEKEFFASDEYRKAEKFFNAMVNDAEAVSYPAYAEPSGNKNASMEAEITAEAIDTICAKYGVTVNAYFQAVLSEALLRISRVNNPMYLTISNGRNDSSMENTVGMFVKTLPVVVHADAKTHNNESVKEFVKSVHNSLQQTYEYSLYPYTEIVERYGLRGEILFAYQGGLHDGSKAVNEDVEVLPINLDTGKLPIIITVSPYNGKYILNVEYDGLRYGKADIDTLLNVMIQVADTMISATKISDIKLVNSEEENALINLGYGPVLERDHSETIISIFKNRVAESPNATAVVFKDKSYTYAELDRISDNLAVYLKKKYDIKAEENVGVLINRSELMLIYPLAIMKNGAAYMPLDPHFPTDRLSFMCDDASVKVILSEGTLLEEKLPDFAGNKFNNSELNNIPDASIEEVSELTAPMADNRMIVLFTSGSTGVPKAVELEHYSMANYCHWYAEYAELTSEDKVTAYANFGFDAHMMDIYPEILAGAEVHILSDEMRKDLQLVNEYIEKENITVAFFTTQVGCLIKDMNKSLRFIGVGGEKLPLTQAPAYRMANLYGPTECSIAATACDVEGMADGSYIGRPLANCQLYIIDQSGQLVPRGVAGELLICGEGVGRGYMNRSELTAEKFITFKATVDSEPVRAYRSGDLVRWAENGNIQYLGRIDKQVKLRGLRIELGEIENRAASFAGIKQVAVDVKNDQLCCYYVAEAEINKDELKAHLAEKLTEFMVPEVYMHLDVMPLNANGKVDRKALPEPEVELGEIISPATPMEENLFAITAKVLKQDKFGVTTNLISVGMSSLAAMRLSTAISSELGKQVRVADIMKQPTVRGLVDLISSSADDGNRIKTGIKQEYYPITENQRGIYIDWEMNRDTTQYNIPFVYKFKNIDANKLAEAVRIAVNAHSGMKASFVAYNGDIMQKPRWDDTAEVPVTDVSEPLNKEFFQSMVKPFDLAEDKLYRMEVFNTPEGAVLFMDIHHIVFDGLSASLLMRDIISAYNGEEVSEETVTAYDLASYEYEMISSDAYQQAEARFDRLLSDANAVSYPASSSPDGEKSAYVYGTISSDGIDKFCSEHGVTINSYMQAAFAEALQRIIREAKPMYITISNGRSADSRLANTVGMFVKTLPVVLDTINNNHGEDKVIDYIMSMQNQLQESYTQEFYPYTRVVERNQLHTNVMFACQVGLGDEIQPETYGDIEGIELSLDTVKTPVDVTVSRVADGYGVEINYDGMKYGRKDMEALLNAIINVSEIMLTAEKVKNIKLINADEEKAIIAKSHGEVLEYNTENTWLSMLSEQINSRADEIAVVDKDGSYSFGELDNVSNKIAGYLISRGVAENDFVTIKMGRKKEFVAAVIAVHKLGAAYVPVDEDYPEERIQYIAENSEAKLIITKAFVDEALASDIETAEFTAKATPDHLAYMIYTSGSTGKPKGVMIPHRAMMNFVNFIRVRWNINENSRIACHSNFAFDASVEDLYPVLTAGGTLYIVPEEERKDIILMREYIKNNNITGGCYTTQLGQMLGADETVDVEYICLGGEKMTTVPKVTGHVYNTYGPTEFTVDATYFELEKGVEYSDIPIGRPLHNCSALILDSYGNLMPDGMVGELCLSGPQLAKGYWKLPEKTAEVFKTININGENIDIYRTGDLARYNENGYIEYLGRIDFQVKLRGFRIEMGEIENRAASYGGIKSVIAQVKTVGSIENLCLYYTAEAEIDKDSYRNYLAESLAGYMVPTVYMQLDEMPMTPNGKIDRKKLPDPILRVGEIVKPATPKEEEFLKIAKELLNGAEFGVTDDLMMMGMSSLTVMKFVTRIHSINSRIRVADVMRYRSIRALLNSNIRYSWFYDGYDPEKPVLIFVHGIVAVSATMPKLKEWRNHFNIFVIEPIDEHYHKLFAGEGFDEVIKFYTTLIEINLPEIAKIHAFMGFSYGGEIAVYLAREWQNTHYKKVPVIMGDSYFVLERGKNDGTMKAEDVQQKDIDKYNGSVSANELAYKFNITDLLDRKRTALGHYEGKAILFRAGVLPVDTQEMHEIAAKNIAFLHNVLPKLKIVDLPGKNHDDLFVDQSLIGKYTEILLSLND